VVKRFEAKWEIKSLGNLSHWETTSSLGRAEAGNLEAMPKG
jgi:hypothetical protein